MDCSKWIDQEKLIKIEESKWIGQNEWIRSTYQDKSRWWLIDQNRLCKIDSIQKYSNLCWEIRRWSYNLTNLYRDYPDLWSEKYPINHTEFEVCTC